MEGGLKKKDGDEVLVTIKDNQVVSNSLQDLPSGSYSFSEYLPVDTSLGLLQSPSSATQVPALTSFSSVEIMNLSPALNTSPRVQQSGLTRRRSLARSVYSSRSKSRLAEPPYPRQPPRNLSHTASPVSNLHYTNTAPTTPKTPLLASPAGEEEDDVYNAKILEVIKKKGKKIRVMILLEWVVFICIVGFLIASLYIPKLRNCTIWSLAIWKWSVLVLVIFCGRMLTGWFTKVLVFGIERSFILKNKVLYFVYSLKKGFRVFLWFALILLAWGLLINRGVKRSRETTKILNYITRGLASCLIGAALWMVKTFLVKLLASSFHVTNFFDRIQESILHQYILRTLSGPRLMRFSGRTDSCRTSGCLCLRRLKKGKEVSKEEVIDIEKLKKMRRKRVSAWTIGGLIKVIRSSGLSTVSGALDEIDDEEEHGQKQGSITNEWEAKAAAYRIFNNVAKHGSKFIQEDDLLDFMTVEEVDKLLLLFGEEGEKGQIKKSSFRDWVVNVYNERKILAHSLHDTKTAIEELTKVTSVIVFIMIIIIWLLLMGFATTQVLVFISSQLLLLVFMIGNACKTAFEAAIFVFVMHPFDVGDRCVIDGVQMIVEEMNILTTIFLRYDGEKIAYPNSVLATKAISNFNRSPEMGDFVNFSVDVSTSAENIVALKARIKKYLESKPQHWRPDHSVQIRDIEDINEMKMALYMTHTINFQNYGEKASRRSELLYELKNIFEELGIKYRLLPQEVQLRYLESSGPPARNNSQTQMASS
ncbi:mechanosensitive ion channel protein 10 isoform X2 [Daucus carota subsp. sativus]|uniref:mechanosensitive ion channel protein 10 isoform X2 n=1 Tax=Daucus carota subsp. sativus TaxID=79200 RepID=UPI0007B24EA0|nr:PREDICTED: mechanosensitive ion channel protein 10-like isoform X2 [Daucus carota subsp. sativus]